MKFGGDDGDRILQVSYAKFDRTLFFALPGVSICSGASLLPGAEGRHSAAVR